MMMITLQQLRDSSETAELLDWPFDFSLEVDQDDIDETVLSKQIQYDVIATEGTGGVFVAYGTGDVHFRPILHGTSEGQAGRVACDLTEWVAVLIDIPYWQDVLKFSSHGDIHAMRETAQLMSTSILADIPELPDARRRLRELLPVPKLDDPVAVLHQNVHATDCTLLDTDGDEWEGLFNSFSPDVLRRQIEG